MKGRAGTVLQAPCADPSTGHRRISRPFDPVPPPGCEVQTGTSGFGVILRHAVKGVPRGTLFQRTADRGAGAEFFNRIDPKRTLSTALPSQLVASRCLWRGAFAVPQALKKI